MNTRNQDIQDKIIKLALEDVAFDGWKWSVIEQATEKAGYEKEMALAVFPEKIQDALAHFSDLADRLMLEKLPQTPDDDMRVRDRIRLAVQTRLECLEDHKEAVREASTYWLVPTRKIQAGTLVWKTADVMWNWAGDTSDDYNHYTKRVLLSGVITTTTIRWLNDQSESHTESWAFLDRRIDNVLKVGGTAGKYLGPILDQLSFLKRSKA
jgi:ubiquinone biosynthesis protein COQ9